MVENSLVGFYDDLFSVVRLACIFVLNFCITELYLLIIAIYYDNREEEKCC